MYRYPSQVADRYLATSFTILSIINATPLLVLFTMRLPPLHVAVFLFLSYVTISQATSNPPTLARTLSPFVQPAGPSLFPPSALVFQTPLSVRYATLTVIPYLEATAACQANALSFFATNDSVPARFCDPDSVLTLYSYITHAVIRRQFPVQATSYAAFLTSVGLTPLSRSRDINTLVGIANVFADRIISYFENDGWNSLGFLPDRSYNPQPYADFTGYAPKNPAFLPPQRLRQPLRWQPLQRSAGMGDYAHQIHVVPHIGRTAMTLGMTREEFEQQKVTSPYQMPNRRVNLTRSDRAEVLKQLEALLDKQRNITQEQVGKVWYWENKYLSLGTYGIFYEELFEYDPFTSARFYIGEMFAQYDALLLAWKEKRRHDHVRPVTLLRRLFSGQTITAYRGLDAGVGPIKVEQWDSVAPSQPHSEFPSASAVICKASLEHLKIFLGDLFPNVTLPDYTITLPAGLPPGSPFRKEVTHTFSSIDEAILNCGESRLNSGVHFEPAVSKGFDLAEGVGEKAFIAAKSLAGGIRPKNCDRCTVKAIRLA